MLSGCCPWLCEPCPSGSPSLPLLRPGTSKAAGHPPPTTPHRRASENLAAQGCVQPWGPTPVPWGSCRASAPSVRHSPPAEQGPPCSRGALGTRVPGMLNGNGVQALLASGMEAPGGPAGAVPAAGSSHAGACGLEPPNCPRWDAPRFYRGGWGPESVCAGPGRRARWACRA